MADFIMKWPGRANRWFYAMLALWTAEHLSIALTTARKHVSNILGKLGVSSRTQAVSRGRDLGLL